MDSLFQESEAPPAPPVTVPEFIEVPVNLSMTISTPAMNSNVGYEVKVTGTCNTAGAVIEISGAATGFGVCLVGGIWDATIDLSGIPIGALTIDFELVQGDIRSSKVSLDLNKPSNACDDPLDRAATFASATPPYEICTITQLENIATLVSGGIVSDDISLRNTLDFESSTWNPINARFTGTFEGNNLSIENFNINQASTDDIGLFKRASGTFQNLNFRGLNITGRNYVGVVAGVSEGAGNTLTINNVNIYDSDISGNNYVGGVVGYVDPSVSLDIDNAVISNIEITGNSQVGGALGTAHSSATNVTMDNMTVSGEVTANQYVGGLIGLTDHTNTTLTSVSYTGDVTGSLNRIGGLIGRTDGATINNSHVIGNIVSLYDGGNEAYVGGLVGYSEALNINTCYHNGNVNGLSAYIGGLVGRLNGAGTVYDSYATLGTITANSDMRATHNIGGLVGHVSGTTDIQRSYSTKNISVTGLIASSNMGGLVGYANGLNLQDSYYETGTMNITNGDGISTGGSYYGGLVGQLAPDSSDPTVTFLRANNRSAITIQSATNSVRTGGLVGGINYANSGLQSISIDDSHNSGAITSTNQVTGGIVGYSRQHRNGDTFSMNNVSSSGTITVSHYGNTPNDLYIGGIFGQFDQEAGTPSTGNVTLTNLSSTSSIVLVGTGNGGNYMGGLFGFIALRRDSVGTFSNWTYTGGPVNSNRGYTGGLVGYLYGANNSILNASNFSVTIPGVSGAINGTYVGGVFGRIANQNNSLFNINGVTANLTSVTTDWERVGGFAGEIYSNHTAAHDIDNITLNVANVANTTTREFTGGFAGRIESRSTTSIAVDMVNVNTTAVTSGGRRIGGFSGYISGNGTGTFVYQDIHSTANVVSTATNGYAGGLIGEMQAYIEFDRCSSTGDVTIAGGGYAGGIAGGSTGGARRISNCFATGDINASGSLVGGLVGRMYGTIENSYATGDVTTNSSYAGGLVGEMRTTTIRNSFATGDVTGTQYVGGLAGDILNPVTVVNAFAAGNVSGTRQVGGFMGRFRGDAGDVDSIYTLGTVTRVSGTQNSFGEICGDCDNNGDVINSYYNSDTVMILGGVGSPELQGNTGRNATTGDLQNPAFYPASWDFVGTTDDDWRLPVLFTLPGAGAIYPYPVPYWLEN